MSSPALIRRATLAAKLRRAAIFEGLPEAELSRVTGYCEEIPVEKGDVIFREGETVERFFIVSRGVIEAYRTGAGGEERLIHLVHAGESFAEAAVAGPPGYPASARALERGEVVAIRLKPFLAHLAERPELAIRMLGSLSRRVHALVSAVECFQVRDTESRLLRWLLDRCGSLGEPATVKLTTTRSVLATELGTRRETLTRMLARLRDCGAIRIEGRNIGIPAPSVLRERLDGRRNCQ